MILEFLSLKYPQNPKIDLFFSILEPLVVLIAPFVVIVVVAVHAYPSPENKICSFTALAFMILLAGIISSIHFVIIWDNFAKEN